MSLKELQRALFISGNLARIEAVLNILDQGQELEGDELKWAIELTTSPRDRTSTSDAWLHDEYISPVLSSIGDLTLVGGTNIERVAFCGYLREVQGRMLNRTMQ